MLTPRCMETLRVEKERGQESTQFPRYFSSDYRTHPRPQSTVCRALELATGTLSVGNGGAAGVRAGLNTCTGRAHTQRESGHWDGTCHTFFLCSKSAATPLPPFAFITVFLSMLPRDLEECPTSLPLPLLRVFDQYVLFCFFVLILGHCQCFLGTKKISSSFN